jgi:hypothetical protein
MPWSEDTAGIARSSEDLLGRSRRRILRSLPVAAAGRGDYDASSLEQRGLAAGAVPASRGRFSTTGGSAMTGASKFLLGLAVIFAAAVVATVQAQEKQGEKAKEVTLKGTILCPKCELSETKKCGNAIRVKKGGDTIVYYFIDKGGKEKYHKDICTAPKEGSVTGIVSKKGKKHFIKPSKDGVKFD